MCKTHLCVIALRISAARHTQNGAWCIGCTFCAHAGSDDKTVRLWGGEVHGQVLQGHTGAVCGVCFNRATPGAPPRMATCSTDRTLRIWDVGGATPKCLGQQQQRESVISVTFSPDGSKLATGGGDRLVHLWDVAAFERSGGSQGSHTNRVNGLALSKDGKKLITGSADATLRVWDLSDYSCTATIKGHTGHVSSVATGGMFVFFVSASADRTVRVWRSDTFQFMRLHGEGDEIRHVALSPDGALIATASDKGTVFVRDAAGGLLAAQLQGHAACCHMVAFSGDSGRLCSAGACWWG